MSFLTPIEIDHLTQPHRPWCRPVGTWTITGADIRASITAAERRHQRRLRHQTIAEIAQAALGAALPAATIVMLVTP